MDGFSIINWAYVFILFILGFFTYHRKSLDFLGSLVMVIMGIVIIFSAGPNWLFLIVLFLILCLIATRYAKKYKLKLGQYEKTRTAKNVISNGVVAFMMAAFGGYYMAFAGGFIGAIATATADTLASEVGILDEPRLVTTFKKVAPGTDGAVSMLGTVSGICGATIIGFASYFLGIIANPLAGILIAIISGTIGCFMDSFLGAVFERRNLLNNEHVNLLATVTGAFIGILLVQLVFV